MESVKGCLSQAVDHSARTPDGVGGSPTPLATLKVHFKTLPCWSLILNAYEINKQVEALPCKGEPESGECILCRKLK
jgi:hypothetical protein